MGDTIALPNGSIEVEERPGYLYVVEHGSLLTVEEVEQYGAALELLAARSGLRRALIDSRSAAETEAAPEVRDAMWRWILTGRSFDQIAFVLPSEMAVVRVNMLARSQRAGVCAFGAVHEAHRWLTGRQRSLSQTFSAPLGSTATPFPAPRAERGVRTSTPPPGSLRYDQLPQTDWRDEPPTGSRSLEGASTSRFGSSSPLSEIRRRAPSQTTLEAVTTPPRRKPDDER